MAQDPLASALPMVGLLVSVALFTAAAVLVLRWARRDLAGAGTLSTKSLVASWLLYVFHADTVATAAWMGAVSVEAPRAVALALGAVIAISGFGVFLAATRVLVRHGDFVGARTRRLVTVGVYRHSRHPQNLGWGIMLLGIAVAGRSIVALALVTLFAGFAERYGRLEEDQLRGSFGDSYVAYRARTPSVIPLPRRGRSAPSGPNRVHAEADSELSPAQDET